MKLSEHFCLAPEQNNTTRVFLFVFLPELGEKKHFSPPRIFVFLSPKSCFSPPEAAFSPRELISGRGGEKNVFSPPARGEFF